MVMKMGYDGSRRRHVLTNVALKSQHLLLLVITYTIEVAPGLTFMHPRMIL